MPFAEAISTLSTPSTLPNHIRSAPHCLVGRREAAVDAPTPHHHAADVSASLPPILASTLLARPGVRLTLFLHITSCWCTNLGQKNGRLLPIIWPGHSTHILCGIISFYSGRINNIISQVLVAGICSLHMCPVSAKILRDKRASSFSFEGVVGLLTFFPRSSSSNIGSWGE